MRTEKVSSQGSGKGNNSRMNRIRNNILGWIKSFCCIEVQNKTEYLKNKASQNMKQNAHLYAYGDVAKGKGHIWWYAKLYT